MYAATMSAAEVSGLTDLYDDDGIQREAINRYEHTVSVIFTSILVCAEAYVLIHSSACAAAAEDLAKPVVLLVFNDLRTTKPSAA
jgi:hypothetical protein